MSVDFIDELFPIGGRALSDLLKNVSCRFLDVDETVSVDLSTEILSTDGVEKFSVGLSNVLDRAIESPIDIFSMDGERGLSMFLSKVLDRVIVTATFLVLVGM